MQKLICFVLLNIVFSFSHAQTSVALKITGPNAEPLEGATVELLKHSDSSLQKVQMTDAGGTIQFEKIENGMYLLRVSRVGYKEHVSSAISISATAPVMTIALELSNNHLGTVTVSARKPFIELKPGKTIVNMESGGTHAGATALEALEKLPGISVDKSGTISLKGKSGVMVMLDGKPTYLDAAQLSTLLSGMSATQISQVEIMDQPGAKYDAAGNAGIINIKTKKTGQKGFNGSLTTLYAQGRYPRSNNSLQLNYRTGPLNFFLNYNYNVNRSYTSIYALRTYFENDGTITSFLEQPSYLTGKGATHTLRTGLDYAISSKTNIGLAFNGLLLNRTTNGNNPAFWMAPDKTTDSLIETHSNSSSQWKNGGVNLNFKHSFSASRELSADVDAIGYRIRGKQFFENRSVFPDTYAEASRAAIPSDIRILSARADYAEQWKNIKWEGGWKSSHITTNNLAAYEYRDGNEWRPDLGKTNHFLYTENIHAVYASAETKLKQWTLQGGLRYEMTGYDANQLGNAVVKDSSFSRNYNSLFPSLSASFAADSFNTFSFTAGRRIDRPAFQKLNPFLFIINKYTYQRGNPFYRPQYTWSMELSHSYKGMLLTGISYSITKDYFSQIFPLDTSGIVIYTEGNLGSLQTFGLSLGTQLALAHWWSVSGQAVLNHKRMEGDLEKTYRARITQFTINVNNQFKLRKGWSGEVSGFYASKSQQDIQEIVDPSGQLSVGVSKNILKNKGTLRLSVRDIFHTQWMKGLTYFPGATEYFKLNRDTRVGALSFTYRFGRSFKTVKRSEGAAGEEIQRVGNG